MVGIEANDIVSVDQTNISTRNNIILLDASAQNPYNSSVDGVIGLSLSSRNYNFLQNSYRNGQIITSAYILSLQNSNNPSYLYINQLPVQIVTNTVNIHVKSDKYFELEIIGIYIGGIQYTRNSPDRALLSSSTPYFLLNKKIYDSVIKNYFSLCNFSTSPPTCNCS